MPKLKLNLTRRWVRARPGSVLILVIALLVLLALIGTAYLSSTQTERYSAVQNDINTEADLLIQGLQVAVNGALTNGLFGNGPTGQQYRPPAQEMPTYDVNGNATLPLTTSYHHYDSAAVDPSLTVADTVPDLILSNRIPTILNTAGGQAYGWNSISWPLFTDSSGNYTFDSPFGDSVSTFLALNKGKIQVVIGSSQVDGKVYPAIALYVPSPNGTTTLQMSSTMVGPTVTAPGQYLTANGGLSSTLVPFIAASASGDGIADAGLCKMPIGQINGITYYYATRVIDGNSAINASSANTQGQETNLSAGMPATNFGFFRSDIGLQELLFNSSDIAGLNAYRFPAYTSGPVADASYSSPPTNFNWYSYADEIENQLVRRPGNPGNGASAPFIWMGQQATAALAYRYSLTNPSANTTTNASTIEQLLPNELLNSQSTPWSPAQVNLWYQTNFNSYTTYASSAGANASPLRTLLVGNNAVSNAVPAQYGNTSATTPLPWTPNTPYNFGDWVVDGPAGNRRSFVCIRQHTSSPANAGAGTIDGSGGNQPEPTPYTINGNSSVNPGAVPYWAGAEATIPSTANAVLPGMPWSTVPVKTSVNTATFEQLWLAFAQVMTDSNSINNPPTNDISSTLGGTVAKQWQPPMQPASPGAGQEMQLGQFRSVIRDSHPNGAGRTVLTSAQMLKLRAAIAAVNTMDLRDSDDDVTSREIVLTDDAGNPQYDVEVYGTEKQPYISEVVLQTNGSAGVTGSPANYIAIEVCNPYPTPISLTGWQIASLNRNSFPTMSMTAGSTPIPPGAIVPAAANGVPGLLILEDTSVRPTDIATTITTNQAAHPTTTFQSTLQIAGLYAAAVTTGTNQPNEIFLMRPRLASGATSKSTDSDYYDETSATTNIADYVPVDQLDLTGIAVPPPATAGHNPPPPVRFLYRRGNDGTADRNWHFVFPGWYDSTRPTSFSRYGWGLNQADDAIYLDTTAMVQCNLGAPTGSTGPTKPGTGASTTPPAPTDSTYKTVPIELNNASMAGPNPVVSAGNVFPYGAFAREADMLKIPFIGAYRIRPIGQRRTSSLIITELNSASMDSALAYDNTAGVDSLTTISSSGTTNVLPDAANSPGAIPTPFNEQIGRFCPIGDGTALDAQGNPDPTRQLDFGPGFVAANDPTGKKIYWHYHWAKRLFDYLTVHAPSDDYYPNVDPAQANTNVSPPTLAKYAGANPPVPVSNTNPAYSNYQIAGQAEDTTGNEGLVNINTAPVPVLAQLPFYGASTVAAGSAQTTANAQLAQAIVNYRNLHGPFQTIYDLYRVPEFLAANNTSFFTTTTAAGPQQGVFSPGGIGAAAATPPGAVRYDFQERFLLLNNISNLITTRSDTFTCYVLLQGWRNVGTGHPTLAVERRLSFLVDRNTVTPSNNQPVSFKIPN